MKNNVKNKFSSKTQQDETKTEKHRNKVDLPNDFSIDIAFLV